MIRIGIDLMGSDHPPQDLLKAALKAGDALQAKVRLTLIGTEEILAELPSASYFDRFTVSEVIGMEEEPLASVRRKGDSSLRQGIRLLQEKKIDSFVSSGNTGALIVSVKLSLPMLPGIDRPALLALLPTKDRAMAVLDVGANLSCKTEHLVQFAAMGIAYQKARGIPEPAVGLLNIGSEETKGTPELRDAYQKLQASTPLFKGNIEGKNAFQGFIDVLVTDGFSGNVFLKTAEGIAAVILDQLQHNAGEDCSSHLKAVLTALRHRLNYAEYPGAIVCGVDGIVVKCHGDSPPESLIHSIKGAARLVEHRFLDRIKEQLT